MTGIRFPPLSLLEHLHKYRPMHKNIMWRITLKFNKNTRLFPIPHPPTAFPLVPYSFIIIAPISPNFLTFIQFEFSKLEFTLLQKYKILLNNVQNKKLLDKTQCCHLAQRTQSPLPGYRHYHATTANALSPPLYCHTATTKYLRSCHAAIDDIALTMRVCAYVIYFNTTEKQRIWKRCDIKHRTKKQDQQIRSIILKNSVVPPAHAQRV